MFLDTSDTPALVNPIKPSSPWSPCDVGARRPTCYPVYVDQKKSEWKIIIKHKFPLSAAAAVHYAARSEPRMLFKVVQYALSPKIGAARRMRGPARRPKLYFEQGPDTSPPREKSRRNGPEHDFGHPAASKHLRHCIYHQCV